MVEVIFLFLAKVVTVIICAGFLVLPLYLIATLFYAIYKDCRCPNKAKSTRDKISAWFSRAGDASLAVTHGSTACTTFFTICAEPLTGHLLLCIWMISYYFQMLVNVVYIRLRAICYPAIWPIGLFLRSRWKIKTLSRKRFNFSSRAF